MLHFLFKLFSQPVPRFAQGAAVNQVLEGGHVTREGVVIGQTSQFVLVEWIRGGSNWVKARELAAINA